MSIFSPHKLGYNYYILWWHRYNWFDKDHQLEFTFFNTVHYNVCNVPMHRFTLNVQTGLLYSNAVVASHIYKVQDSKHIYALYRFSIQQQRLKNRHFLIIFFCKNFEILYKFPEVFCLFSIIFHFPFFLYITNYKSIYFIIFNNFEGSKSYFIKNYNLWKSFLCSFIFDPWNGMSEFVDGDVFRIQVTEYRTLNGIAFIFCFVYVNCVFVVLEESKF